jgi:cyclic pyranopterin phosphate synthase
MLAPGVYAFEEIDEALLLIPLAARRALDAAGRKLSLEEWLAMPVEARRRVVAAGCGEGVDPGVEGLLDAVAPGTPRIAPQLEPDAEAVPIGIALALGPSRPLDDGRWRTLHPLERYVLAKYAARPEKLALAYGEIVSVSFTHLAPASRPKGAAATELPASRRQGAAATGPSGEAHMVDVGAKEETARRAVASSRVATTREVLSAIASGRVPKGDVFAAARVAAILAAKRTPELVPLCHPVRTTAASIDFEIDLDRAELQVVATVEAVDRTGVEMEAMVAASVASLTIYDMIKSADRWATISAVRLEEKSGGKSGAVARPPERR